MRSSNRALIVVAGSLMLGAFIAIGLRSPGLGSPSHLLFVGIAAIAYSAVMLALFVTHTPPSGAFLILCLLFAIGFRVPLWMTGPGNDVFRYVWDARVQRAGYNPYIVVPSDPALAAVHTDETRHINNADLPTPYPPGAQVFFRLVSRVSETAYAFKIALGICDVALAFVLWRWLIACGIDSGWLLAYAWNPAVILTTAGEGHLDLLGALWLMMSVLFLTKSRRLSSMLCFGMAVAVKPLPIVLLPLFWRRVRVRDVALGAALLVAMYLPYSAGRWLPTGSLGAFVDRFRFNQTVFVITSAVLGARGAGVLAVLVGLIVAAIMRARSTVTSAAAWAWPMATALAMSPVVYPWYLVWLTPFFVSVATVPLLTWSVTVLGTYVVWHRATLGEHWTVPMPVLTIEFGVLLATSAWIALRARRPRSPILPLNHGRESEMTR